MNNSLRTIATILFALFFSHFSNAQHTEASQGGDNHRAADTYGLSLNQGQRWVMDEHTRQAFAQMESAFSTVDLASASPKQLMGAATRLKQDLRILIKGCTITGAAHDQLHQYLVSYMPAVNRLADTGDAKDADAVADLLAVFPRYFE